MLRLESQSSTGLRMQPYPRSPDLVWPGHLHGSGCLNARAVGIGFPTVGLRFWLGPGCGWVWVLLTPASRCWGLGWVCFRLGSWCCPSFAGCLWCSWLGFGVGPLLGRVWFRARFACPPPFPVPVCGVGVRAGPGSRLCPALLGWVVGLCFLRIFFPFFSGCPTSLSRALWSLPPSPFVRAGLLAFFFSWCVSACFGAPFPAGPLFVAWCCRFWLGGPPVPLWGSCLRCPLGGVLCCRRAVWWLWAVCARPPPYPPPFFGGGGGGGPAVPPLAFPWLALALWLLCGVVGPSPLLAEVPVCYFPPLLAGFRCRCWWAVPATPGLGPLAAVVCGVWCVGGVAAGVWCGWSLATPGGGSCVLLPATPGWVSLPVVVGGPRHSWLGSAGGVGGWCVLCGCGVLVGLWLVCGVVGPSPLLSEVPLCYSPPLLAGFRCRCWWAVPATPGWGPMAALVCGVRCVVVVCWWGYGWCVVWLVPRHSWRRFLCATPRHSWLGFAAGGGGRSPPLLAGVRWRPWCVVRCVWCVAVVCWWGCGWCVVWLVPRHSWRRSLCATPRHFWLGFAAGGGGRSPPLLAGVRWRRWCVVCGVLVGSLATPGGGSSVLLPATPGWVSLPVLVGGSRHSWLGSAGGVGVWCAVCGGGVLVGLWLVCGVVGPSPLLAEVPVCYSTPLLAGSRCRWWWAVPATPGWGPLAAVVCGVWCVAVVCWWGCGWCVVWLVPRHSWRRSLCATPRHSWLGFAAGVGGRFPPLLAGVRWRRWCVVCGVWRWCVGGVMAGVWCGLSLATPGGGSCVLLLASPGWVSLPVVVGGPRHSWLGSAGGGGVWCVVCGGGVLVGLWLVCGVVGPSPLLAEVPVCHSPPLLAGFRCRWWWAVPATPGWGPLAAVVCGVWRLCVGGVVAGRGLPGRVGRAGLPGAFWCASPFPLAALSFCLAWPPPGWGCPPLSGCCCCSRCVLVGFFFFLALPRPCRWLLFGCFSPAPLPFFLSFSSLLLGALVFFFSPSSSSSVRPRCLRLSLVSGPGCPGPRRLLCLLCWPAAFRLSVRLSLFRAFRLAVGRSLVVAAPPPPLCVSRFSSLPLGAVCRVVVCVPGCGDAPRCCALCRPVLCCRVLCCVRWVPLLVAPCPLALPVALGPCALRRCVLRCSPAVCVLCCVCFVVARWCVLLFAALLCAVCVPGCCAVRSLCSPLCAVLCFAVLVRSRCAVRVVRAVAGAWCCGALLCVVLFPVVCRGAVLGLVARGCLLVACFGVGVPVWPRGLLPCGWCGLLWCPAFLCRVLWCRAVAWCCAVVLCCRVAVLLGLALPSCGLSCCAVLCCWLAVLFFARSWCLRAVVLFSSCCAFPAFSALCAAVPCCAGCGALLSCVVCCGAVLSCCAVLSCSAVVLPCCLCLLCPPAACRAAPVWSALLLVHRAVACPCVLWCLPGRSAVWWRCSAVSWGLAVLCAVLRCPAPCAVSCGAVLPCGAVLVGCAVRLSALLVFVFPFVLFSFAKNPCRFSVPLKTF